MSRTGRVGASEHERTSAGVDDRAVDAVVIRTTDAETAVKEYGDSLRQLWSRVIGSAVVALLVVGFRFVAPGQAGLMIWIGLGVALAAGIALVVHAYSVVRRRRNALREALENLARSCRAALRALDEGAVSEEGRPYLKALVEDARNEFGDRSEFSDAFTQ